VSEQYKVSGKLLAVDGETTVFMVPSRCAPWLRVGKGGSVQCHWLTELCCHSASDKCRLW